MAREVKQFLITGFIAIVSALFYTFFFRGSTIATVVVVIPATSFVVGLAVVRLLGKYIV